MLRGGKHPHVLAKQLDHHYAAARRAFLVTLPALLQAHGGAVPRASDETMWMTVVLPSALHAHSLKLAFLVHGHLHELALFARC